MSDRFNIYAGNGHRLAHRVSRKTAERIVTAAELADQPGLTVTSSAEPRFRVKRRPVDESTRSPWALKDLARPAFVGSYATHELALRAADNIVRRERGLPERIGVTRREIREAMSA